MGFQNSQITGLGIKIMILRNFKSKNPNRRFFDFESIWRTKTRRSLKIKEPPNTGFNQSNFLLKNKIRFFNFESMELTKEASYIYCWNAEMLLIINFYCKSEFLKKNSSAKLKKDTTVLV